MKLCFLFRQITRNLLFLIFFFHNNVLPSTHRSTFSTLFPLVNDPVPTSPKKILSLLLLALLESQSHPPISEITTAIPLFHNPLLFCILFPMCFVMINSPLLIVPWFMLSLHMLNPFLSPKLLKFQSDSKLCK